MFKESSMTMEMSPTKKGKNTTNASIISGSPMRESNISKISSKMSTGGPSPQRNNQVLDLHKKTGIEVKQSPSKNSKIAMKYINSYTDVGPQIKSTPITHEDLIEMAKTIDKKECFVKTDLRLIFAINDNQLVDETIETLTRILQN